MESHMYNAKCLGMKYIRFTDHDSTICRAYVPNIDFSKQQLDYTDENGIRIRFDPIGNTTLDFEENALRVASESEGGVSLWTKKHYHMITLLADVKLTLGITLKCGIGHVTIKLSERPPMHEAAKLTYPLNPGRNDLFLRLADEVGEELGGLDNAITGIELNVNGGELLLDTLKLDCIHDADDKSYLYSKHGQFLGADSRMQNLQR